MGDNTNPWVTGGVASGDGQELLPAVQPTARRETLRGPTAPQPTAVQVPESADRLPTRQVFTEVSMWWLGAHGGAGETTLSALVQSSQPADHAWPLPNERGASNRVTIVARTNYAGLMAAQRAAREWAAGTTAGLVDLAGLVLIADAPGRRPKELRQLEQHIAGGYPRLWTLPWVEAWRMGPASPDDMPREYRALLADLNLTASTN
ncbi:hypothetical protein IFT90_15705 [Frigoribacterium sp. CFBP 8766]|uniref:DUF6668 family protein n=1 Tax=Frigoribacterium sp. CFBP 8766 TaxID=2775273 RepID=UPI001781619D|nr:DUF6668 family protein [Frigoribacterium sp. CFBP 8766]MBD8586001.1 hypothetical protein [Frigoribacterium sp. CFBP 8766]